MNISVFICVELLFRKERCGLKKVWTALISLLFIGLVSITAYKSNQDRYNTIIKDIKAENISSIGIEPAGGIIIGKNEPYLDLSNSKDTVNSVINWIKSGSIVGDAKDEIISNAGSPTRLIIKFKNGTSISIQSAVGKITSRLSNGAIKEEGYDIDGQVTIYIPGVQPPIREYSPQLKSFIDNSGRENYKALTDGTYNSQAIHKTSRQ